MVIVLVGASGTGKSTIENELATHYGYKKIISYTTRKARPGEENGNDYYFTNLETFMDMRNQDLFAEWDEYSQQRLYGTLKADYAATENKVVVLTPNGLRSLRKQCPNDDIYVVYVKASLGIRVKRYIDRCGVDKFNFDDMNEINARVNRDFGMFVGVENEADLVIHNDEDTDIFAVVKDYFGELNNWR